MAYTRVEFIQTDKTYINTGLKASNSTKCVFDCTIVSLSSGDCGVISNSGEWNNNTSFTILVNRNRNNWTYYCGGKYNDYAGSYALGNRCTVSLDISSFKVYDTVTETYTSDVAITGANIASNNYDLLIGAWKNNNSYGTFNFYEITIYSNNVVVGHYLPYKDTTTGYGVLYDEITDTFLSGGTPASVIPGPEIGITVDKNEFSVSYNGTAETVSLSSENPWTAATVPSWVSVSPNTGNATTAVSITIEIAKNKTYVERSGVITFADSFGNTCNITIIQTKAPLLVPKNNIYREGRLVN